ncbi:hypothetical protein Dsin_009921 [Dipteronia sinensis]|uniref:Acid phosphatase n=1 Tax=Dipteronia sinensis TaxID=43782 RepID=A0AAE0ARE5_9ROSI|nr:hypothetical protein Dsin_009921 [Dipteronia sinensis]
MFVAEDANERYVRYGEIEEEMDKVSVARVKRYKRDDMCDAPANTSVGWRDPGNSSSTLVKCRVVLCILFFQLLQVESDSKGWSKTHSFVSRNEDSDETIAFLFGDMGTATPYSTFLHTQDESISTVKWILRDIEAFGNKLAFVSHVGDTSYARGYEWLWDQFFVQIEPVASKVAYHVCIGNHEYNLPLQPWRPDWAQTIYRTDGGGECGVPYSLRFHMPGNSSEPTGTHAPATRNLTTHSITGWLVATKEKLVLSYVGNHDGAVHNMVEILASGQVLNNGGGGGNMGSVTACSEARVEVAESKFTWLFVSHEGESSFSQGFVEPVFSFLERVFDLITKQPT